MKVELSDESPLNDTMKLTRSPQTGPTLSGTLVEWIGFDGLIICTACICFSFAPLLVLLKDPPPRHFDDPQLQEQAALRYVNYSHLDPPDEESQPAGLNLQQSSKIYVK